MELWGLVVGDERVTSKQICHDRQRPSAALVPWMQILGGRRGLLWTPPSDCMVPS